MTEKNSLKETFLGIKSGDYTSREAMEQYMISKILAMISNT